LATRVARLRLPVVTDAFLSVGNRDERRKTSMPNNTRFLSAALIVFGLAFCLLYPLSIIWPSGWAWHDGGPMADVYFPMILGVYATLGIFMILAAKDPAANASLIWFVVSSSIVHAFIMAWESVRDPMMQGHLAGDVPILLLVAVVLGVLMSRTRSGQANFAA
jgi:hypothetical protein